MNVRHEIQRLWTASPALTAVGLGMLAVLGAAAVGLALDPRLVGGQPVWLKPAKFAISTAIYSLTLAWFFTQIDGRQRAKRIVGTITASVFVLEVGLIALQAGRGTTSHFNVATIFDGAVFAVMGLAIVVQSLAAVAIAVLLFRQPFADRALGWGLRLGLVISLLGASTGGLMTRPTGDQLASAQTTRMTIAGAHTVGAPDGGPGLPGTGWSREHGDIRVPHFVGLHAFQALPLFALFLGRIGSAARRTRAVLAASASYGVLFGILLVQALMGQSVLAPSGPVLVALGAWLAATVVAIAASLSIGRTVVGRASMNVMVS